MIKEVIALTTTTAFIFLGEILISPKISLSNGVSFIEDSEKIKFEVTQIPNEDYRTNAVCGELGGTAFLGHNGSYETIPYGTTVSYPARGGRIWKEDGVYRFLLSAQPYPATITYKGTTGDIEPRQFCPSPPPRPTTNPNW